MLQNKQEHANLAEQMRHVEAVIKMLDPGYSLRAISVKRRQPNPWFKRGTVYCRAVDVLRTATEPLTARDIVERVLVAANIKRLDNPRWPTLSGQSWPACGITRARGLSELTRVVRQDGGLAAIPQNEPTPVSARPIGSGPISGVSRRI